MSEAGQILRVLQSGGWLMIPLFGLALLLYTQAFHLLLYVRRAKLDEKSEERWWDWVRYPDRADGRVGEIIRYTQEGAGSARQVRDRFEAIHIALVSLIDRRARFVSTLVSAAPLLGLLGTVLGMLQTFLGLSRSSGTETAGVVAAGISEALVTTQTGLTIALPGLFVVMMIQRQQHTLEAQLARLESLTLSHMRFE